MTKTNAKTAVILLALMSAVSAAAPSAAAPNQAPAGLPAHTFANDSNLTFGADGRFDTSAMFWRMILALLLVAGLAVGVYYASRKLGPRIVNLPGRQIHLSETFYLGSKKALHLIKVGDKNILIAATPTSITAIADLGSDTKTPPAVNRE